MLISSVDVTFNIDDYVPVFHRGWHLDRVHPHVQKRPCNKLALYIAKTVHPEDRVKDEDFRTSDGHFILVAKQEIDGVPCPICGNYIRNDDIKEALRLLWGNSSR